MIHQCWPLWVPEMACVNYNYDWPNPCSCCLPDRWDQQVQPILFRCGDGYMYGTLRNSLFSTSKLAKSWLWLIDWLMMTSFHYLSHESPKFGFWSPNFPDQNSLQLYKSCLIIGCTPFWVVQTCFMFHPIWDDDLHWCMMIYVSRYVLKPPTREEKHQVPSGYLT